MQNSYIKFPGQIIIVHEGQGHGMPPSCQKTMTKNIDFWIIMSTRILVVKSLQNYALFSFEYLK